MLDRIDSCQPGVLIIAFPDTVRSIIIILNRWYSLGAIEEVRLGWLDVQQG